jgi:hypothetical protein
MKQTERRKDRPEILGKAILKNRFAELEKREKGGLEGFLASASIDERERGARNGVRNREEGAAATDEGATGAYAAAAAVV